MIHGCTNAIFIVTPLSSLIAARLDLQVTFLSPLQGASLLCKPDTLNNSNTHTKNFPLIQIMFVLYAVSGRTVACSANRFFHPPYYYFLPTNNEQDDSNVRSEPFTSSQHACVSMQSRVRHNAQTSNLFTFTTKQI